MMKQLRPYQEQFKADIYDAWDEHQNVMAVLPTGLGKTITFCSMAKEFTTGSQIEPTAIICHRKELVQQISLTLSGEGLTHNIITPKPVINGIIAAQRKLYKQQFYNYLAPITVVSVDTLNSRIAQHEKWARSIKRWITDEAAHLLKSNKWGRAVEYFPQAKGLGVTATPQRLDKRGLGRHADGVFDTMVEGPTTRWGIENGYLCKYKIAVPKSDFERYLKKSGAGSDFTTEAMETAAQLSHIVGDVVENYRKFADGRQAILFGPGVNTCERMEKAFNDAGIPAKALDGTTPDNVRLETLIAFEDKRIRVLLNVDLFDEGLDVPGIECVIHARPTMSLGKYRQMNGRGLRIAEGKEFLMIIDHVGNVTRHGLPCKDVNWTLDRIIKRHQKVNLIRICGNPDCNSPYDRTLHACPWCNTEAVVGSGSGGGGRVPPVEVDGDLYLIDPFTLKEMEDATYLEDPGKLMRRVAKAAGEIAGKRAMRNQLERIETQKELANKIAIWCGRWKSLGDTDRQLNKRFYLEFSHTISGALSLPNADMKTIMEEL